MHVKGEAVIHYGHSCFTKTNIPVFTVLPKSELNINSVKKLLFENFNANDNTDLCLFYDAEFEHSKGNVFKI